MRARKTIDVRDVLEYANAMIAASADEQTEGRVGIARLLERILFDTGNYKGFQYVDGNSGWTDDSRRLYFGGYRA